MNESKIGIHEIIKQASPHIGFDSFILPVHTFSLQSLEEFKRRQHEVSFDPMYLCPIRICPRIRLQANDRRHFLCPLSGLVHQSIFVVCIIFPHDHECRGKDLHYDQARWCAGASFSLSSRWSCYAVKAGSVDTAMLDTACIEIRLNLTLRSPFRISIFGITARYRR
jgi:hypothetical protein